MNDPQAFKDEIQRMWQAAEVYESQGMYDQAIAVYQDILAREPENRKAQAKVVQIQFTQRIEDTTLSPRAPIEDFSPTLALDLGLAYVGMNLYAEALEEFEKGLPYTSGETRFTLLRYCATCLIRLQRFEEAATIIDQIVLEQSLPLSQRGGVLDEIIGVYLEEDLTSRARDILLRVPPFIRSFVTGADSILAAGALPDRPTVGEDFLQPDSEDEIAIDEAVAELDTTSGDQSSAARELAQELEASIPVDLPVTYSFDNRTWRTGLASRVSADWALIHVPDRVVEGDSLVIRIHLPREVDEQPIWIITRITKSEPQDYEGFPTAAKVQFVSFLPGGEVILKSFLDEVVKNPALAAVERHGDVTGPQRGMGATDIFAALQAEAIRSLEDKRFVTPPEGTDAGLPRRERERPPARRPGRPGLAGGPRIRFACQCGQVHVVPIQSVGRKGTCGGCGNPISVPLVDTRPDSLAEKMIGMVVGGCRLLYKIGGGGMGGVFKGHHIALDIPVAVKVLHAHLAEKDPVFIKRFIREARAAAKLQHPNIVGVMNVGFENGVHFLLMPFVAGGSAAGLLARQGRLSVDRVLQIGAEIARALMVAEESNMLHRDVKPANILFNTRGEAMLADLGLAKNYREAQDSGITQTGITCGTPLYFSPEQAKGAPYMDIRSDIYSLGITLYHLLAGVPPFTGESAYVIFQKHVHDPLPPLKGIEPPIPDTVFRLVERMAAKKPDDRFQNTSELLEALEGLREELSDTGKPVNTSRRGLLERLGIKKPM
jgi:hypothetical protein